MIKKVLSLFVLFFVFSISIFAKGSKDNYAKSELGVGANFYMGGDGDAVTSCFGTFFGEYNRYLGPDYYCGNRIGIFGSEKAVENDPDGVLSKLAVGFSEQVTFGIKKDIIGDDSFKISPFAEVSAGVLICPTGELVRYDDDDYTQKDNYETQAKFLATPSAGVTIKLGFLQTKVYWTTNYISGFGFAQQAIGISSSIRW